MESNLARTEADEVLAAEFAAPGTAAYCHHELPGAGRPVIRRGPKAEFKAIAGGTLRVGDVKDIPKTTCKSVVAIAAPELKKPENLRDSLWKALRKR